MHVVEYVILGSYLLGLFGLGLYFSRGHQTTKDFFLAGRKMGWIILGMSMWASLTSANSMIAAPGYSYGNDLQFLPSSLVALVSAVVIMRLVIPIFQRLDLTTSYEYLERRFGLGVRCFASTLFLLLRGAWLAGVIYAPALAVSQAIDLDWMQKWQLFGVNGELAACILAVGLLATAYATAGGMKAVIYTDVVQFIVIVVGVGVICWTIVSGFPGGVQEIWEIGQTHGRTKMFNFDFSPFAEVTFWWILANTFTTRLNSEGIDQVSVQRYLSARSLTDSVRTILLNVLFDLPLMSAFYLIGLGLFAFYHVHPDTSLPTNGDRVFPFFVATQLPLGMAGLFLAALLAATRSSVDSGINSMAATVVTDWYQRLIRPSATEDQRVRVARTSTVLFGGLTTLAALLYIHLGQIYQAVGTAMGLFMGPLVGIFFLGLLTTRARTGGVLAGAVIGLAGCALWQYIVQGTWMLLPVVGLIITWSVGYALSWVPAPLPVETLRGLTCWTPASPGPEPERGD